MTTSMLGLFVPLSGLGGGIGEHSLLTGNSLSTFYHGKIETPETADETRLTHRGSEGPETNTTRPDISLH